jgi:hypothetical protein
MEGFRAFRGSVQGVTRREKIVAPGETWVWISVLLLCRGVVGV